VRGSHGRLPHIFYLYNHVNEDETNRACSTYKKEQKCIQIVGTLKEETTLGILKCLRDGNIKMEVNIGL
jgi:hypothetical protein